MLAELERGKSCEVTVRSYVDTPVGMLYSEPSGAMTVQIPAASVTGRFVDGALTAEIAASGDAMLIASSCASDGRAAETKLIPGETAGEAGKTTVETGLTQKDGLAYRLMLVGKEGFVPLCEMWSGQ